MSHRRGFATLTALGLVMVAAVAIAALTTLVAQDVKRSLRQAEDAQLRQLLMAGEVAARASLDDAMAQQAEVALPAELASAGYRLRYEKLAPDAVGELHVRVTASRPEAHAFSQHLRYARVGDAWKLRGADLP